MLDHLDAVDQLLDAAQIGDQRLRRLSKIEARDAAEVRQHSSAKTESQAAMLYLRAVLQPAADLLSNRRRSNDCLAPRRWGRRIAVNIHCGEHVKFSICRSERTNRKWEGGIATRGGAVESQIDLRGEKRRRINSPGRNSPERIYGRPDCEASFTNAPLAGNSRLRALTVNGRPPISCRAIDASLLAVVARPNATRYLAHCALRSAPGRSQTKPKSGAQTR